MASGKTLKNPYVTDHQVAVSAVLSCTREEAWEFLGTPAGYARWFPSGCEGTFEAGAEVRKTWWWDDDESTIHAIVKLEPLQAIEYEWEVIEGAVVRYEISDNDPTVATIQATYPGSEDGRAAQLLDVAPWTFAVLNLKSVASGGLDLRYHGPKPATGLPFVD
jgi:uncharacterized protein YndB with AHSA1/START domain